MKPPLRSEAAPVERRLGLGLTGLAFLLYPILLWRGWGRWNDVLVDYGRELYVPWRLAEGDVLYRDVAYFNGPLSPYWNALWFTVAGDSLQTLTILNACLALLFALVLHRCMRCIAGPIAAGASLLFFFPVLACGHFPGIGNYNFLSPYSHELTHGLLLGLAALYLTLQGRLEGKALRAFLAGLLLGLCFLTKAEVFLACAGAVGWVLLLSRLTDPRGLGKRCALLAGGAVLGPLLAFSLLAISLPAGEAARGTLGSWSFLLGSGGAPGPYYETLSGMNRLSESLADLMKNFGWLLLLFGPAALLDWLLRTKPVPARLAVGAVYAGALCIGIWQLDWDRFAWMFSARSLPLIAGIGVAGCSWFAWRGAPDMRRQWAERSAFAVFAFLLLLKILLSVILCHYGFALTVCAVALLLAVLMEWIPQAMGSGSSRGLILRCAALAWLVSTAVGFWSMSETSFEFKTVQVGTGSDKFWADPVRGEGVRRLLNVIDERLGKSQTLLVLPEGITINFLSRRRTPTRHVNFMPPELQLFGERAIHQDLRSAPDPAACVLVHKDTSEYGVPLFGIDYGVPLMKWVRRRYEPDWLYGQPPLQPGTQFGIGFLGPR